MTNESKLKPFDLERAKAGDKVLALNMGNEWTTVLSSTFESDDDGGTQVLLSVSQSRCWYYRQFKNLRMAPKTRTVWHALCRDSYGFFTAWEYNEADLRLRVGNNEILAIHSLEVPE